MGRMSSILLKLFWLSNLSKLNLWLSTNVLLVRQTSLFAPSIFPQQFFAPRSPSRLFKPQRMNLTNTLEEIIDFIKPLSILCLYPSTILFSSDLSFSSIFRSSTVVSIQWLVSQINVMNNNNALNNASCPLLKPKKLLLIPVVNSNKRLLIIYT